METKLSRRLAMMFGFAAAASAAGVAVTRADVPGYLFLDLDDNHATVVNPPRDQSSPRISKLPAKLSDEDADALVADAQPVGRCHIVVAHRGQLYIVPDKRLAGGEMASAKVMEVAMQTTKG
jgi:hypothetical protein